MEFARIWPDIDSPIPSREHVARIYFGSELCERMMPYSSDLKRALDAADRNGFEFTLLTPVLGDEGMDKALWLFQILSEFGRAEVVVSAWGTLEALKDFNVTPVIGRMLSKQKRGPEILNVHSDLAEVQQEIGANVGFSSDLVRFARKRGAVRFELDPLAVDSRLDLDDEAKSSIAISMHARRSLVSVTRFCMTAAFHDGRARPPYLWPCEYQCKTASYELVSPRMPRPISLEGNALFLDQPNWQKQADAIGADRIVLPPEG